ncbi:MAG: hypothetical protein L0Z49_08945 [Actinobacteria bacterium]|nr:hypothetical protein [Actinomycetota bacterium]MCI0544552.1 hypothetical protein [Actinomycetota bacterium]
MSGDVRVVEETHDQESRGGAPAPWLWLLIGLAVGLGAGVLFGAPALTPTVTTQVEVGDTAPPLPNPSEETGVSDVVAEFPDALVAISQTSIGSYEYVLWPHVSDVVVRGLPIASSGQVSVDTSGRWVAATTALPGSESDLLSMGLVSQISPVATKVSSYAWHDGVEGLLAYTTLDDDGWGLWVTSLIRGPSSITSRPEPDEEVRLAAWGDWGFAIHYPARGRFDLLTPDGLLKTNVTGVPVGSHESGWILVVEDGQTTLVSAGGGVRGIPDLPQVDGPPLAGAISPDGRRVAVLGSNGLVVGSVDGSEKTVVVNVGFRHSHVWWSSDSRFVIAPALRGVTVFDTRTRDALTVLEDHLVVRVGVIPLNGAS